MFTLDNKEEIWNFFINKGFTKNGTSALMGNLYAESGLEPTTVERLCLKRYKEIGKEYNDLTYTNAVNNGSISREEFISPMNKHYGYGIAQWTNSSRKSKLYDICKSNGVSISDLQTQLNFIYTELYSQFNAVFRLLKSGKDIKSISDRVLSDYEHPANIEEQKSIRYKYALQIYNKYEREKNMGYNVQKVIDVALNEVGYCEKKDGNLKYLYDKTANAGSNNYTKYGYEMHKIYPAVMDYPASWCDAFNDWCFMTAYGVANARSLLSGEFDDYTIASANLYKKHNAWLEGGKIPQKGYQIFFKNSTRIHHTGLVVDVYQKNNVWYVVTVEGNTSPQDSSLKVVANGGQVCKKEYPVTYSAIAGYGIPAYGNNYSFTPHWVKSNNEWYYRITENQNAHGFRDIEESGSPDKIHRYYFDSKGKMLKNWQKINDAWYYFQPDGNLEGAMYVSDENGKQSIAYL